jgi:hypothetical protein
MQLGEAAVTNSDISPDDAARALSDVADRRRQVAGVADPVPGWYFPAAGVLVAGSFALMDMPSSAFYWPGAAIALLGWSGMVWLARRQQRIKPHGSLYGVRGWALIAGAAAVFALVGMLISEVVQRSDIARPNAVTGVALGLLLAGLGTILRLLLRREFARRAGSR